MTKDEILNGMSEAEFYRLYPTRESWEAAQAEMAYGGSPYDPGIPFGAGITMAYGGYLTKAGSGIEMSAAQIAGEKAGWASGYGSAYGKDAFRRTSQAQLLKEHPGLKYVSGDYRKGQGLFEHTDPETQKKTQYYFTQDPHGKYMFYNASLAKTPQAPVQKKTQPVQPTQVTTQKPQPQINRKEIGRTADYITYQYPHPTAGYSQAETKYIDTKTGQPIADISKAFDSQGKYIGSPQPIAAVTPNNSGTTVNKYGGTPYYGGPIYPAAYGGDIAEYCWGGLPGGPNEMPAMEDGGFYVGGNYNSPTNYGSFSVPMNQGGYNEFGGAYDTTNAGTYPMMNTGGYGSKIKPSRKKGGDITSQGGNQSFLDQRNSSYLNYIKNNVLNNMHEEESQKVQDAFMQMESQMPQMGMAYGGAYMQMGGYPQQAFDRINPQNAALQNMYSQQINQFQQQHAKDAEGFRNMFLPQAQKGSEQPTHSALLHQLATEFGPSSRRTGLPLFPANVSSYYGINKKDAAKLAGIPQGFKMEGLEITPQWGLGARTAMNIGNWFRNKDEKRTTPGWAPKKIHYKFTGKRGYLPGEPRPDTHETLQPPTYGPPTAQQSNEPYGPIPAGTTQAPVPFMPASIKPGYNASGRLLNQQAPGLGPAIIPASSQFNTLAYGGMPMYQGSILGSQTGNPIDLQGNTTNMWSFQGAPAAATPTPQSAGLATSKVVTTADESKNTPYVQGPQVMYDPTRDRSQEDVTVEGDIKRKWKGVGEAIGQYAVPAMNTLSSILEQKDVRKAKKKLEESMVADNVFMTSPMNAENRGDYDPNSGMFRPNQMVPVQFPGYAQWGGFNTFADGGVYDEGDELDLTPEEIEDLRQQGYEIEYLD